MGIHLRFGYFRGEMIFEGKDAGLKTEGRQMPGESITTNSDVGVFIAGDAEKEDVHALIAPVVKLLQVLTGGFNPAKGHG